MDRADRYILRQFLMTFFFGLLAFVTIYVAVDLMENLDDFFDRSVPGGTIVQYYLYFIPEMVKLIVPIAMLLASLFTISRLDSTHELTALRATGRSMRRIVLPLLAVGFIVSGAMVWFNGWGVPHTNKVYYDIRRQYLGKDKVGGLTNLYMRVSPTLNLQLSYFNSETGRANTISFERLDSLATLIVPATHATEEGTVIKGVDSIKTLAVVERIDAEAMTYDSATGNWKLVNGTARNLRDPEKVVVTQFKERILESLPLSPKELTLSQQNVDELTLDELREKITQEEIGGRDVKQLLIDYHAKFAFPFSALIVIFFGIPFSSAQRKGGAAIPIALTAVVSAIYLVFTEVSKTLTTGSDVHPMVTAWLANGVFFIVGIINLYRIDRG